PDIHNMTGASSTSDRKCCSLSLKFVSRDWKNRLWQRTHRQGAMKKRFSIHSNSPCLLERRISEHPHFTQTAGFTAASIRTLLPAVVGRHNRSFKERPTVGLICGEEAVDKCLRTRYALKEVNFYLKMINSS